MRTVILDELGVAQNLISKTPTIINKTLTTQNTEYDQALPERTKRFTLQARTAVDVKLAFEDSASGTTYITVKSGSSYSEEGLDLSSKTLRLQCASDGIVVEIIAWT
jgi:uncharacterized surface anchored protein